MIEAHIISPRGSLYFSAPATPYDLENLRTHVKDAAASPQQVHVQLALDSSDGAIASQVSSLVRELTSKGVDVSVL